jgi:hypothetical protein
MKVNYNKFGLKVIGTTFILSVIINMWIKRTIIPFAIAFTMGVFFPYILVLILALIFYLFKNRELYFFTDWRVAIFLLLFESIIIYDHLGNN